MYLLFSNYKKNLGIILTSIILVIVQSYFPLIAVSNNLFLSIDFLLLYLTFLSLKSDRLYIIIFLAFTIGIFQDFVIQNGTIGLYSFIKVLSVYLINYIKHINNLWSSFFKGCFLLSIYFLHYLSYHYILAINFSSIMILFIFFESLFNILLFFAFNKIFFKLKYL
jgi:hypothetical protein